MSMTSAIAWGFSYWLPSDHGHQSAVVLYEIFKNFKIPYFAYIFAKVSRDHYSSVSSFTHAAVFAGNFIAFVSVQLIADHLISGHALFYVIFSAQIIATLIAICLPSLDRMQSPISLRQHSIWIFEQLKFAYTNYRILIWSLWYIGGTSISNQFSALLPQLELTLLDYRQWDLNILNLILSLGELAGILLTLLTCYVFMRTRHHALILLIMMALCSGGLMFLVANTTDPSMSYILIALLNIIYKVSITMSR